MFDVNSLLHNLQHNPQTRNTALTAGGGALAGLAAGMFMGKGGRKMMGTAAKYGGIAAIGGLAYHAFQNYQKSQQPGGGAGNSGLPQQATFSEIPPRGTAFLPAPGDVSAEDKLARSLIRSMIAAAQADGVISPDEKTRIFDGLQTMDLDAEAKAFVFDELSNPADVNSVVRDVQGPEHAIEIYAAALMAIDADTAAERAYLQMLAARLNLEDALVAEIHSAAQAG